MAIAATRKADADNFLQFVKDRRTYYSLGKGLPIAKERVQQIVTDALKHVPSPFNSQSNRVVVLFGSEHDRLWDIAAETLRAIVPEESWKATGDKMAMFRAGAGTVMFFEDQAVVDSLAAKFPAYADRFPGFATQTDAMLQFAIWTALEAEGLGANLQHYNPIIDAKVAEAFKIPESWRLNAQLVFGARTGEPGVKTFMPIEDRMKVYGA
jgi:uncharacterized protein